MRFFREERSAAQTIPRDTRGVRFAWLLPITRQPRVRAVRAATETERRGRTGTCRHVPITCSVPGDLEDLRGLADGRLDLLRRPSAYGEL